MLEVIHLLWCQMLDRECQCFVYVDSYPAHHHRPWGAVPPALFFLNCFFPSWFFLPLSLLPVISGMTGNYLLTNPLLRTHDTNPYNNLLAETVVCNTPSPPAFHSPGAHPPSTFYSYADLCFCVLGLSSYRGEFDETIYTTHVSRQLAAS